MKEVIAAKRARQMEAELHKAERAADDTHVRVENRRRQAVDEAGDRLYADLNGILEDTRRALADPAISDHERELLKDEEARVLKLRARMRV